jgi:hypothetical protein
MALRMAFAILRWFLGRRPVSLECFIRPVSVMYSDMIVKFCVCQPRSIKATVPTHLVFEDGVDAQHVKGIALRLLAAVPPLLLLGARQILRRVDIAGLPLAVDLALELGSPLRLDHLGRLRGAVEAGIAGHTRREGAAGAEGSGGSFGSAAAAEDRKEGVIWESSAAARRCCGADGGAHPSSGSPQRSIADTCATTRRRV